ncbi:hypothetical protein [Pseudomonas antarctica]|uniref:hypothetical protein n=1 Tax=Pseudomonas antarctica TaxID=219572 RepID=UPI00387AE4B3
MIYENILITFGFITFLVLAAIGVGIIASHNITLEAADQILVHARSGKPYNVRPEPVERAIYIILSAFAPAILVGYFWIRRLKTPLPTATLLHSKIRNTLPIISACLLTIPFWGAEFTDLLFFPTPWAKEHKYVLFFTAALLSAASIYHSQIYNASKRLTARTLWWTIALLIITLQIVPYRIVSINSVTFAPVWSVHLDAALYALNQVIHGNTLIADLPSQYGLFPEIIAPLFEAAGFSIFKATVFFAILHALGLTAIAALLRKHVRNPVLSMLIFLALSVATCLFMYLNGINQDIYIQYFPIRFFWPALALLLISIYSTHRSKALFCTLGIVSGIAVFWNLDTGIPVLISVGATLFVKSLITRRPAVETIGTPLFFAVISASTLALLFGLLRIKAGSPLDFSEILAYQKIFYMTGFGMLPMPMTLHPWQAILIIYAVGAITALNGWKQKQTKSGTYDVLFCSAIMGLGLFAYYQGRSHVFCLVLVSWPAVLISGVLADLILQSVRRKSTQMTSTVLAAPFVLFFSLGAVAFITSSKNMVEDTLRNLSTRHMPKEQVITEELQFMRDTYRNRSCLILSQRQAIYSAELDIGSPLKGPGIAETLLQSDLDSLVKSALSQPLQCIYVGITEGSITFIDVQESLLMEKYPIVSKNALGTMMLLEPAKYDTSQPAPVP